MAKTNRMLRLFLLFVVLVAVIVYGERNYHKLDCETRFVLEKQYIDSYSEGAFPMKNATFTLEELQGDVSEVCDGKD